jgi:organic hydroperoxide reductase OsmC/OhrA
VPKRFEYSVAVDRDGRLRADGDAELEVPDAWTPEHLLLSALVRCSLASLAFYAERAGRTASGTGAADGVVTQREDGGRYAFVDIECGLDVEVDPPAAGDDLLALLDSAEQGCFIGASLTAKPRYEWRVNGELVDR